jgi:hypothetical protein
MRLINRQQKAINICQIHEDFFFFLNLFLKGNKNLPLIFVFALQFVIFYFRNKFYQGFYGAFDDQFAAMDAVLNGKELFAHWVIFFSS